MSPFEIALIIIGIICIIVSCFFIENKKEETVDTELGSVTEQILHSHLQDANEQIASHMDKLKKDIYDKTEDELDHVSNQKIMEFHEYSDQVLGDIKKNHSEVLFLYQMLTDKEEELKTTLDEMKKTKRDVERFCIDIESEIKQNTGSHLSENFDHDIIEHKTTTKKQKSSVSSKVAAKGERTQKDKLTENKKEVSEHTANSSKENGKQNRSQKESVHHYTKAIQSIEEQEFSGHIEEIIKLSSQGLSVIEISKKLGLGQGEVKLVLDYNKK